MTEFQTSTTFDGTDESVILHAWEAMTRRAQLKPDWSGVFPAVTTQFREDLSLDVDATARVIEGLIRDGVSGLIVCGTVGENCSLAKHEKIAVMEAAKAVARGRVPVLSGIAEFTSSFAIDMAKEAARIGLDGVMVMPALVYSSKPHETAAHFRSVAGATDLPVMVYNNPPIYKNDVTPAILASLADCETIVCFKESSGDTRRFTDLTNMIGSTTLSWRASWSAPWAGYRVCRTHFRVKARRCSDLLARAGMPRR